MTNYYDKEGNRVVPYKEDSTKGSSIIQPIKYKCDALVEMWIDSRVAATLLSWMEHQGYSARSFSDAIRRPLEVLVESLISSGDVKMIEDTNEARNMIETRFRVKLARRDGKGGKNRLHNQILTDKRRDIGERIASSREVQETPIMPNRRLERDVNALVDIFNSLGSKESITEKTEDNSPIVNIDDLIRKEKESLNKLNTSLTQEDIDRLKVKE